jgi:hypothetical protein
MTSHPSEEALASLVHGLAEEDEARRIEKHLATCPECYAAYAEAIRHELEHVRGRLAPPSADDLASAARIPSGLPSASYATTRGGVTRSRALTVAASLAAMSIVIGAWVVWRSRSPSAAGHILVAVRESSARGMVLPGGEAWADRVVPDYRGGPDGAENPSDSLAEAAIRSLADEGSPQEAVWALSGYVGQGRLRIARAFVVAARRRFPDDVNLEILDGVISYRNGEAARAENVLRGVVSRHPGDALARLDLGMLLAELGRPDARPLLEGVIKDAPRSPLANRARRVLEKLPA